MAECSVCCCDFSVEDEGGVEGYIGMIPSAFCPTCYAGVVEMVCAVREKTFGLVRELEAKNLKRKPLGTR